MHAADSGSDSNLAPRSLRTGHLRRTAIVLPVAAALLTAWGTFASAEPRTPSVAGCSVLPADNVWNTRIDGLPVHPRSDDWVRSIGATATMHPDFGSGTWNGGPIGIPYTTVAGTQAPVDISFEYADESDPGPYRIPPNAPIEGGGGNDGDRHVLVIDRDRCRLTEVFAAEKLSDTAWRAGSGAHFDLTSNALRPAGWTSADAAGLPIFPGLVRYDEVALGEIAHALRFTAPRTQRAYVWPARHFASDNPDPALPPMGARFRLKADVNPSAYPAPVRVILIALQRYGMILADNGSSWYLSGAPDERWDNDELRRLREIVGSRFEAVDASSLMVHPDSGQARASAPVPPPSASCAPRPPVRVITARGAHSTLNATLSAQDGTGAPSNALESVQVAGLANAQAAVGGRTLATGESVRLPAGTRDATPVVQRVAPGQASTVRLVVTDACGPWPTFVGGGPSAF